LEWATSRKIQVSPEIFTEPPDGDIPPPSLSEALRGGGIHYRVSGSDKASVLQAVVDTMQLPEEVDRKFLYQVLLAREALGSTGLGEGIAIPHVRNPIVLHVLRPMVTLCFLEQAVDYGAIDGQPVSILFTLVSPTVRAHLHLLSRLGYALRDEPFKKAILRHASREEIFEALIGVESAMTPLRPVPPAAKAGPTNSD
jgi:PTS system nitrogen regulatory IIA component